MVGLGSDGATFNWVNVKGSKGSETLWMFLLPAPLVCDDNKKSVYFLRVLHRCTYEETSEVKESVN